jgi:LuxR family maltose regulon positive regulatory protein
LGKVIVPPVAFRSTDVTSKIPATVFLPPGLPPALLERRRLEELLGPPGASKLSVVIGAAGAGKTTLVRAWLRRAELPWAWVTLDQPGYCADRFWRLLIGAVHVARPGLILDASDLVTERADEPLVVVIDDAHNFAAEGWDQLSWLLQHQPTNFHLVLVSRRDPPFSLARLEAAGTVCVVRDAQPRGGGARSANCSSARCSTISHPRSGTSCAAPRWPRRSNPTCAMP